MLLPCHDRSVFEHCAGLGLPAVLGVALLAGGCTSVANRPVAPPKVASPPVVLPDPAFDVPERVLDTFNGVGRVLVSTMDAMYDSRSQMLGIYEVHYHGDHFLIRCKGLPLEPGRTTTLTHVEALNLDSSVDKSPAAVELLGVLQQRLVPDIAEHQAELQRQIEQQQLADQQRKADKHRKAAKRRRKHH